MPIAMMHMTTKIPSWESQFTTADLMVGQRVSIETGYGEEEVATVIAVSTRTTTIKVRAENGDILCGNQWEPVG